MPKDLRPLDQRNDAWKRVLEVQTRLPDGIPLLDPVNDMKITDNKFTELVQVTDHVLAHRLPALTMYLLARKSILWSARCSRARCTRTRA